MRVAIAGKGGSGKTTISGTLARSLAEMDRNVLAIDADSNPNLASLLGVKPEQIRQLVDLPRDLLERRTEEDGTVRSVFAADPDEVVSTYGIDTPGGVRMMIMGHIQHSGAG
jgi:CO dehydrogenase maturation factor